MSCVTWRALRSVVRSPWRNVMRFTIPPQAATPGTGIKSPTFGSLLPGPGLLSLRAARSSAFAVYAAPPCEATAMAQATACPRKAVCVQLAHVLAWLSNLLLQYRNPDYRHHCEQRCRRNRCVRPCCPTSTTPRVALTRPGETDRPPWRKARCNPGDKHLGR